MLNTKIILLTKSHEVHFFGPAGQGSSVPPKLSLVPTSVLTKKNNDFSCSDIDFLIGHNFTIYEQGNDQKPISCCLDLPSQYDTAKELPIALVTPAFGKTKEDMRAMVLALKANGYAVISVDEPNSVGQSYGGIINTNLEDKYIRAVIDWLYVDKRKNIKDLIKKVSGKSEENPLLAEKTFLVPISKSFMPAVKVASSLGFIPVSTPKSDTQRLLMKLRHALKHIIFKVVFVSWLSRKLFFSNESQRRYNNVISGICSVSPIVDLEKALNAGLAKPVNQYISEFINGNETDESKSIFMDMEIDSISFLKSTVQKFKDLFIMHWWLYLTEYDKIDNNKSFTWPFKAIKPGFRLAKLKLMSLLVSLYKNEIPSWLTKRISKTNIPLSFNKREMLFYISRIRAQLHGILPGRDQYVSTDDLDAVFSNVLGHAGTRSRIEINEAPHNMSEPKHKQATLNAIVNMAVRIKSSSDSDSEAGSEGSFLPPVAELLTSTILAKLTTLKGKADSENCDFNDLVVNEISDDDISEILIYLLQYKGQLKTFFSLNDQIHAEKDINISQTIGEVRIIKQFDRIMQENEDLKQSFLSEIKEDYDLVTYLLTRDSINNIDISLLNDILDVIISDPQLGKKVLREVDPDILELIGHRRAIDIFNKITDFSGEKRVPAYIEFIKKHNQNVIPWISNIKDFRIIPITTKSNYVHLWPIASRCVAGKLPNRYQLHGSAGSSGKETKWITSKKEIEQQKKLVTILFDVVFNTLQHMTNGNPICIYSGYSSGIWAAGSLLVMLAGDSGGVANFGTDEQKMLEAISSSEEGQTIIIGGYPPWLKKLGDLGVEQGIDFQKYNIHLLTGGDGFDPQWRSYMKSILGEGSIIVSAYGASDLSVGMANETHESIAILDVILKNHQLREALLGKKTRPIFFGQYDPASYYVETIKDTEGKQDLIFTMLDPCIAAPKIRYNIGDSGGVLSFHDLERILSDHNYSLKDILGESNLSYEEMLKLPFLFLWGRSDGAISINGANVYPSEVDAAILNHWDIARLIDRHMLEFAYENDNNIFKIHIELKAGINKTSINQQDLSEIIKSYLLKNNADYAESFDEVPANATPHVVIYAKGEGPFEDGKIKNTYIKKS